MNEIGGYIELDNYVGTMFHQDALALNLERNYLTSLDLVNNGFAK